MKALLRFKAKRPGRGWHGPPKGTHTPENTPGGSDGGQGFNEKAEFDKLMIREGQSAKPKPGITRPQIERFYKRRDAVKAAENFRYQGGATAKSEVDSLIKRGFVKATKKGKGKLTLRSDKEPGRSFPLNRREAVAYFYTATNSSDYAMTY